MRHANGRTLFGDRIDDQFNDWLADHPHVVDRFIRLTRDAKNRGRRVGAKAVWERLRWEEDLGDADLNNNLTSRVARYVMSACPDLEDYFHTRELRAS